MACKRLIQPARLLVTALVIGLLTGAASAQPAGLDWRQFRDRSGTYVDYPAALFSETRDASENGVTLARRDGRAQLRIFAVANARGETPRGFLRREFPFRRSTLSYDRVTARFFVVSARRDDRIVYTRCNFAERIHCIELTYPSAEKRPFDPVTTRISLSLRPR